MFGGNRREWQAIEMLQAEVRDLRRKIKDLEREQKILADQPWLFWPKYVPLKRVVYQLLDYLKLDIEYIYEEEGSRLKKRKKKSK